MNTHAGVGTDKERKRQSSLQDKAWLHPDRLAVTGLVWVYD